MCNEQSRDNNPRAIVIEDGTAWPHPNRAYTLEDRLRYGNGELSRADLLEIAQIVNAYATLIISPAMSKKPAMIRRAMRKVAS